MPKIEANGINFFYQLHGPEEADVLVLSNGVLMSTASWAYQVPALSKKFRLLLYDCRGMWQSDHPPGPYTMNLHAQDLVSLLDELSIEKAHIGGASYGAEISLVFALLYPERTKSLIVTSAVSQVDPVLRGMVDTWVIAAEAQDSDLLFKLFYPLAFTDEWIAANQAILDQARERYKQLDFEAFLELLRCFLTLDITPQLKQIRVPTLIVVGEKDLLKQPRYSEIIAEEIPNAQLEIIPRAAHAPMWEQSEKFNRLILNFLASGVGSKG